MLTGNSGFGNAHWYFCGTRKRRKSLQRTKQGKGIIADCVDELQPFIDEVMPREDDEENIKTEELDVVIRVEDYLE